jgi:hypothetical protein
MPFLGCGFASQTQGIIHAGLHAFEILRKQLAFASPKPLRGFGFTGFSALRAAQAGWGEILGRWAGFKPRRIRKPAFFCTFFL